MTCLIYGVLRVNVDIYGMLYLRDTQGPGPKRVLRVNVEIYGTLNLWGTQSECRHLWHALSKGPSKTWSKKGQESGKPRGAI